MILDGDNIYLRDLQESDIDAFYKWYGEDQVTRLIGMKPLPRDKVKTLFNYLQTDQNIFHSYRTESTGLAVAALKDWKQTFIIGQQI